MPKKCSYYPRNPILLLPLAYLCIYFGICMYVCVYTKYALKCLAVVVAVVGGQGVGGRSLG